MSIKRKPRSESLKISRDEWRLLRFLDGRKTFGIVAVVIGYVGYLIHNGSVPAELGVGWMISSLLPLAINSRISREVNRGGK